MSNASNKTTGILLLAMILGACSPATEAGSDNSVDTALRLRNLTDTAAAAPAKQSYTIPGRLIPTPSDPGARYYLLRQRAPLMRDTLFANLREERGDKISYARIELSCEKRLFHIIGVGQRRSSAEFSKKSDGELRPIDGLPLREEIASFVCAQNGTPLAKA